MPLTQIATCLAEHTPPLYSPATHTYKDVFGGSLFSFQALNTSLKPAHKSYDESPAYFCCTSQKWFTAFQDHTALKGVAINIGAPN